MKTCEAGEEEKDDEMKVCWEETSEEQSRKTGPRHPYKCSFTF